MMNRTRAMQVVAAIRSAITIEVERTETVAWEEAVLSLDAICFFLHVTNERLRNMLREDAAIIWRCLPIGWSYRRPLADTDVIIVYRRVR